MVKFEIYFGQDEVWHWRLKATNGEIVCWSEGYASKQGAITSVNWVKTNAPYARIIEV